MCGKEGDTEVLWRVVMELWRRLLLLGGGISLLVNAEREGKGW